MYRGLVNETSAGRVSRVAPEKRAAFDRDGFAIFDEPLISRDDVDQIRSILDPLFARFDTYPAWLAHDLGGPRVPGKPPLVAELEYVTVLAPRLLRTRGVKVCQEIARDLSGRRVPIAFSHSVYKPGHSSGTTPWHQDAAYDPTGRKTIAVWLALQDTNQTNGCMRYVIGSQQEGGLPHHAIPGRHGKTIDAEVDESRIVDVVLPIGGASAHREFALHSAGPNNSDEPRRSLILEFAPPIDMKDRLRIQLNRAKIAQVRRHVAKQKEAVSA